MKIWPDSCLKKKDTRTRGFMGSHFLEQPVVKHRCQDNTSLKAALAEHEELVSEVKNYREPTPSKVFFFNRQTTWDISHFLPSTSQQNK